MLARERVLLQDPAQARETQGLGESSARPSKFHFIGKELKFNCLNTGVYIRIHT